MKKKIVIISSVVVLIALILVDTFIINPRQMTVRQETISSNKLSESFNDMSIAFFADTHYDVDDGYEFNKAIASLKDYNPDLILFGGDLINKSETTSESHILDMIDKLSSLDPKLGKYAVLGNHDLRDSKSKEIVLNILDQSGFTVLNDESVKLYINDKDFLNLVGLRCSINENNDISSAYSKVVSDHYTITLMHVPDTFSYLPKEKTDYVLSAHSHGGQVYIPLISLFNRPVGAKDYYRGKYTEANTTLDITNGVGMTNKKVRLFADSEVVIYKLVTY